MFDNDLQVRNMSENTAIAKHSHWLHTMAGQVNYLRGGQEKRMFSCSVYRYSVTIP